LAEVPAIAYGDHASTHSRADLQWGHRDRSASTWPPQAGHGPVWRKSASTKAAPAMDAATANRIAHQSQRGRSVGLIVVTPQAARYALAERADTVHSRSQHFAHGVALACASTGCVDARLNLRLLVQGVEQSCSGLV